MIRLARDGDLAPVLALLHDCVRQMRGRGIDQWDDVYPDRSTLAGDIQSGSLYVALADGAAVVGAVALNAQQEREYAAVPWQIAGDPVAVVHRLMVHPTRERAGLGRALMAFAERRASELGFRVMRLDTFLGNPGALALYRALGYREAGEVTFRKGRFRCFEKSLG